MKRVVVIGAGLGGLSASIRLASAGYRVTVLEQQAEAGGKLQRVELGAYRFDRGPSTITMRHAFERVFAAAGKKMEDYVDLYPLSHGVRNVFADGSIVDLSGNASEMELQIAEYSYEDAREYRAFMEESAALYRLAERLFFDRLLLSWKDKLNPRLMAGLVRVRPWTSMNSLLRRYFRHPNTLAMFGRYATYVGSSPQSAPSIFALLPHLEASLGVYGVAGGTYSIVNAFARLAQELGVDIQTSVRVEQIVTRNDAVVGVATDAGVIESAIVIANGDVLSVNHELLPKEGRKVLSDAKISAYEPSLSGFVVLAGIRKHYPILRHHTVFYPPSYGKEFKEIFGQRTAPSDPAIYLCHSGLSESGLAPRGASNLFILANAPYLSDQWDWQQEANSYRSLLLGKLKDRGITGLADQAEVMATYTPLDLYKDTSAYRGAIYGISSNTAKQTFFRPSNQGEWKGLWFTGGTTHPGGGTPMVTLSGQLVAEHIIHGDQGG